MAFAVTFHPLALLPLSTLSPLSISVHWEVDEITPNKQLPKRDFLFTMFGKPCLARGELVAVTGKSKSGKTYFCSSVLAAASSGACLGLRRAASAPLKALWIDTEQSEESTQEILNLRLRVLVGSCPLPRVFNLRGITWDQRMSLVEAAIEVTVPEIVIFDGIRDVVSDINDGVMAQQVASQSAEQQTDNPYIYYDANNVRKARISTLLRDCLPAGRELNRTALEEEIGQRIGNKLWAYNILKAVIRNGNLVCRKDENGLELLSLPCV